MARRDCFAATRDFRIQSRDALFQFMRRKRGNIFTQHDIGQFLALKIVRVHLPKLLVWP